MAHARKPDFVFRRNGPFHLNRRGTSVQSTTGSRGVRVSGSNAGYTMFRGSVKSTGDPLHSPVSPSRPLPYVTVCHHISTGLYKSNAAIWRKTTRRQKQVTPDYISFKINGTNRQCLNIVKAATHFIINQEHNFLYIYIYIYIYLFILKKQKNQRTIL
jgi:hypothetical protein